MRYVLMPFLASISVLTAAVPPPHGALKIEAPVLFSELDGGADDLDGAVNGVLSLRGLEIKDGGALLIDVPVAGIIVAKDVKLKSHGAIRPAAAVAVGPALSIEAGHKIELGDDAVISVDGTEQGGSLSLFAGGDLKVKKRAAVTGGSSAGAGGSVRVQSLKKIELTDDAVVDVSGSTRGGEVIVRADGDVKLKKDAAIRAPSSAGAGGTVHVQSFKSVEQGDHSVIDVDGLDQGGHASLCAAHDLRSKKDAVITANASGPSGRGGEILLQAEHNARIEHRLIAADGDSGGSVTILACAGKGTAVVVKGRVQAIGANGPGGAVDVEARLSRLQIDGRSGRIDATGSTVDGTIRLRAGDRIDLDASNASPLATLVPDSPSSQPCVCVLGSLIALDLASEAPIGPRDSLRAIQREVESAQATYPGLAADLQLIDDQLEKALRNEGGEGRFVDACHIVAGPGGSDVFLQLARGIQRIQRLLPWDEIFVDAQGQPTPPAVGAPVPESLKRISRRNLTRLMQACALIADVAIQEARGVDRRVWKSADRAYADALNAMRSIRFVDASRKFAEAWEIASAVLPAPVPRVGDAPVVNILTPAEGEVVGLNSVVVTGMVQDIVSGALNGHEVSLEVNGVPAQVVNRSYLAVDVPLRDGLSAIVAVATDVDGNRVSFCRAVTVDTGLSLQLRAVSGNNQTGPIQTTLDEPLAVEVYDDDGVPLAGTRVVYRILQGNGGLGPDLQRSVVTTTSSAGVASVAMTLGSRAGVGVDRGRATAVGVPGEVIFCLEATGVSPEAINQVSGDNQKGAVSQPLPLPLVVLVTDPGQNPLENVPVTFAVRSGGGSLAGATAALVLTDSDGRAAVDWTLGPDAGLDNNFVEATFAGLANEPAVFKASGFVLGDPADTRISGVVLDNQSNPVPGVTLRIKDTDASAVADAQGQFTVEGVPVGDVFLRVDATTTTRPGVWANLEFELVTLAGVNNTLEKPIYILPLDLEHGAIAGGPEDVTITMPGVEGFSLTVLANSVSFPGGGRTGLVSVTAVTADKIPMAPGSGMQPRVIVTVQPAGAHFDPPAPVTFPNVDGMPPGTVTEMFSFDHDLGEFVSIGTGAVSEDGLVVRSDPGFGIVKAGWHCAAPGSPTGPSTKMSLSVDPGAVELLAGKSQVLTASGTPGRDVTYHWERVSQSPNDGLGDVCTPGSGSGKTLNMKAEEPGTCAYEVTLHCTTNGNEIKKRVNVTVICGKVVFDPAKVHVADEPSYTRRTKKTTAVEWSSTRKIDAAQFLTSDSVMDPELIDWTASGPGTVRIHDSVIEYANEPALGQCHRIEVRAALKNCRFDDPGAVDRMFIVVYPKITATKYGIWKMDYSGTDSWLSELPPVYCATVSTIWDDQDDPEPPTCNPQRWEAPSDNLFFASDYHPGADAEMRSEPTAGNHGHQATYGTDNQLITSQAGFAAGTADFVHHSGEIGTKTHGTEDVSPFIWAVQLDGNPVVQEDFGYHLSRPLMYRGDESEAYFTRRPTHPTPTIPANSCTIGPCR